MNTQQSEDSVSANTISQYEGTTNNLERRIAIYKYSTNPQSWFSFLSSNINAVMGQSTKILDIGAGTGDLWKNVRLDSSADLTLADFSDAMCTKLRALDNLHNVRVVDVVQCDAAKMPFEAESFDILVASHMLYHVESPSACIAEFARVLKLGGFVFISLGSGSSQVNGLVGLARKLGRSRSTHNKVTAEMASMEMKKHFNNVKEEVYEGDLEVPSAEPVLSYLESMPDGVLSEEQRKLALDTVENEIAEKGYFAVNNSRSLLIGTRS